MSGPSRITRTTRQPPQLIAQTQQLEKSPPTFMGVATASRNPLTIATLTISIQYSKQRTESSSEHHVRDLSLLKAVDVKISDA